MVGGWTESTRSATWGDRWRWADDVRLFRISPNRGQNGLIADAVNGEGVVVVLQLCKTSRVIQGGYGIRNGWMVLYVRRVVDCERNQQHKQFLKGVGEENEGGKESMKANAKSQCYRVIKKLRVCGRVATSVRKNVS